MQILLFACLVQIPLMPYVAITANNSLQAQYRLAAELEQCYSRVIELACEHSLDIGRESEWQSVFRVAERFDRLDSPMANTIKSVCTIMKRLFSNERSNMQFPNWCGKVAAEFTPVDNSMQGRRDLIAVLLARLYLRASQNGAHGDDVAAAARLLVDNENCLSLSPKSLNDARIVTAFKNYVGVTAKLEAQCYKKRVAQPHAPIGSVNNDSQDLTSLLNRSFKAYEDALKVAEKSSLSESIRRIQNNQVDWVLLLCSIRLFPKRAPDFDGNRLLPEARSYWLRTKQPDKLIELLDEQAELVKRMAHQQLLAPMLVTLAQTECLLAEAINKQLKSASLGTTQPSQSSPEERIRSHLFRALHNLEIAFLSLDEIQILDDLELFHLAALRTLDSRVCTEFDVWYAKVTIP